MYLFAKSPNLCVSFPFLVLKSRAGTLIWATTVVDVSTLAHTLQTPTCPAGGVGASPVRAHCSPVTLSLLPVAQLDFRSTSPSSPGAFPDRSIKRALWPCSPSCPVL